MLGKTFGPKTCLPKSISTDYIIICGIRKKQKIKS